MFTAKMSNYHRLRKSVGRNGGRVKWLDGILHRRPAAALPTKSAREINRRPGVSYLYYDNNLTGVACRCSLDIIINVPMFYSEYLLGWDLPFLGLYVDYVPVLYLPRPETRRALLAPIRPPNTPTGYYLSVTFFPSSYWFHIYR